MSQERDKCDDCNYKSELMQCIASMKNAIMQMNALMVENEKLKNALADMEVLASENEQLKKEKYILNYKILIQKKSHEKFIRELTPVEQKYFSKVSSAEFYKRLYETAQSANAVMKIERENLIAKMREKYGKKRILFVLPIGATCGGASVIVSEAAAMRRFGVDAQIINLTCYEKEYRQAYEQFGVPAIFISDLSRVIEYKNAYDVICATACTTVKLANFSELAKHTKVAYYVQDYEPFFFKEETELYQMAKDSYTLVPEMQCVTKTEWNRKRVKENTGVDCKLIYPSVHIDIYFPEKKCEEKKDFVVVTAMIRPDTPRRGAAQTMKVLQNIFWKYGKSVQIHIFGNDEIVESEFFIENATDFEYQNHGLTVPQKTAELLQKTDVFVDFSLFQAMGLTAMEAMASGCAVIVPQNGGATAYAENEKNALLVDTADVNKCENALSRLIENRNLREKLAMQAVMDVCRYYPERSAASFLESVLE